MGGAATADDAAAPATAAADDVAALRAEIERLRNELAYSQVARRQRLPWGGQPACYPQPANPSPTTRPAGAFSSSSSPFPSSPQEARVHAEQTKHSLLTAMDDLVGLFFDLLVRRPVEVPR